MPVSSNVLKCLPACKNQLCDNMIDMDFEESRDNTVDEYESDNISGRMSFIHQCLIFDSHPAKLLPQFCYLLFRSECLFAMYVYKFDLMLHTLH